MVAIGSNVANVPSPNPPTAPTYCVIDDVVRYTQLLAPSEAADEGELTQTHWNNIIIDMEGEVDRVTGSSWRARRVELEYHDRNTRIDEENWVMFQLRHFPAKTLSAASGDALEVRQGNAWENWLDGSKTEGVAGHYWLEEDHGFLRIRRTFFWSDQARVRIKYRYGFSAVPQEIREATALLAGAAIKRPTLLGTMGRGGEADKVSVASQVEAWERRAYTILASYQGPGVGY